jgi:hypothetical protein
VIGQPPSTAKKEKAKLGSGFARLCVRNGSALKGLSAPHGWLTGLCMLGVLSAGSFFVEAQSADKGKQVIDAAVAGLGGAQFLEMRTRVASGRVYSFFHDQLSGFDRATVYTEYLAPKPAQGLAQRERERMGKKQDYSYLFLPDQGWDITFRGARPIPDEIWQRYLRSTENDILYLLRTRRNEPGLAFDYIGNQVYLSRHVEIVDITDSKNRTIRVYFDFNTKLPVRQIFDWLDPDTKEHNEEISVYDKYRDVGQGIMWPYSIERERNGYKTYQFFAEKIAANEPIPTVMYELPPGAKLLKKVD